MKITKLLMAIAIASFCCVNANADGVIDGSIGSLYGSAVPGGVQSVQTGFGDQTATTAGSELDAAYAYCANGRLYMAFAGNLEENFNKMEIFIDAGAAGGENTLSANPDYDFNGGSGWNSSNMGGMIFDNGFAANYHMFIRSGGGGNFEVDFIDRLGGTSTAVNGNTGTGGVTAASLLANNAVGSALANDIFWAFDNTNIAGVAGGSGAADAAAAMAVTTGFEFSIDLADLGLDSSVANTIRIAAMVNNGDHNYLSNQILGGLPAGTGNLGGDGSGGFIGDLSGIDFNNYAGDQYITVNLPAHAVPEPGSIAILLGSGLLAISRRRR